MTPVYSIVFDSASYFFKTSSADISFRSVKAFNSLENLFA